MITVPGFNESFVTPRLKSVLGVPPSTIHDSVRAVFVLHVKVDPGMRVDPLDFRHRPLQKDGPIGIELRAEGVMSHDGQSRGEEQCEYRKDDG